MRKVLLAITTICAMALLQGCAGMASKQANAIADQAKYQPITYSEKPGPTIIVIPGEIKSMNTLYTAAVNNNNIADFAEIELSKAHYTVLERANLGPMFQEYQLAVSSGNPKQIKKFQKGQFKTTNWLVRFDILKAEPVSQVTNSFDGSWVGQMAGAAINDPAASYAAGTAISSVNASDSAAIWIIGLRYKILDASTGEQIATNYFEDKLEVNAKSGGALGISQSETKTMTLDTMTQRLLQKAVADMDRMK